ncbi:MAG: hypothetical protein JWM95_2140 [Gemmatimonadetes bacterium]|nr:hypothetical protein [Gemmatimonadota bacterium]
MTAHTRLLQLRRFLQAALVARAIFVGASIALGLFAVARLGGAPSWSVVVAVLAGLAGAGAFLRPLRLLRSLSNVALWVEERTPSLRYALVTVADGVHSPALEAQALGTVWWSDVRTIVLRSLIKPAVVALVVAVIVLWNPFTGRFLLGSGAGAISGSGAAAQNVDPLAVVHVVVTPPAYAGKQPTRADDPTSVEALVGSAIALTGDGNAALLTATADSASRSIAPRGSGWSLSLTMPARPAIVKLHSSKGRDRLFVLAPIADAVPVVTLLLPAHDTIVRRATGRFALHAQVRDDIGLRDAAFELVISSGTGENFTFRSATIGHLVLSGTIESALDARISLDSLQLKPGDILQLRAVARDGNTVNGPGLGASETRSIRVARADEYDSVAVDAAPPPDTGGQVLSQRMLIMLTEALVKRQRTLSHAVLLEESLRIASDERKLRKRVGDVVFQRMGADPLSEEGAEDLASRGKLTPEDIVRLADSVTGTAGNVMDVEGDETPILAINKPLLEAFNAMWEAGRSLEVGEPAKALPPMRIALAAIEKARQAERIYLRGRPGTEIVDITKVRLTGKDKGVQSIREVRPPIDPVARRRSATFERVTNLMARDPEAAADSLLLLRVEALTDAPALAAALDDAAKALRKHDNSAIPLMWMRVRRVLGDPPVQRAGIAPWQGGLR